VLDGRPDPQEKGTIFWENVAAQCKVMGHFKVGCAKTAEPIKKPFWMKTRVDQRNHVLDGVQIPQGKGQFVGVVQALFASTVAATSLQ